VRVLDTNVLVRLVVNDDERQVGIAREIIEQGPFVLLPSVLIETVWVARSRYRMAREDVARELKKILGAPTVVIVSQSAIAWAFERFEAGADFADMVHFALAEELEATSFATFDKRIKPHQIEGSAVSLEQLG